MREKLIQALNVWLGLPQDALDIVSSVIFDVHTLSLMYVVSGLRPSFVHRCIGILFSWALNIVMMKIFVTDRKHRLDDIEDDSPLRRSRPSTHNVFGIAQTINAATYRIVEVVRRSLETRNPKLVNIVVGSYNIQSTMACIKRESS